MDSTKDMPGGWDSGEGAIWSTQGLAQGDACSPKVLCGVLAPWEVAGESFLFMDDRSVVANAAEQLEADLEATNKFDAETGALENAGKRQVWHRGEKKVSQTCARSARVAQHKKEADYGVRKSALDMVCASIQPSPREASEVGVPSGGQGQMLMVVHVLFLRPKPRVAPGF